MEQKKHTYLEQSINWRRELDDDALEQVYGGAKQMPYLITCSRCGRMFPASDLSEKYCDNCRRAAKK